MICLFYISSHVNAMFAMFTKQSFINADGADLSLRKCMAMKDLSICLI